MPGRLCFSAFPRSSTGTPECSSDVQEREAAFLRFHLGSGDQVLVDVETKNNTEIMVPIQRILGKSEETLKKEEPEKKQFSSPSQLWSPKVLAAGCMCEVEGQVPCPGLVPLPKAMTGKSRLP